MGKSCHSQVTKYRACPYSLTPRPQLEPVINPALSLPVALKKAIWTGLSFTPSADPILPHTNQNIYDHCVAEDLVQSAVVMARSVYFAAMRDEMPPRKPQPIPVEVKQRWTARPDQAGALNARSTAP